VDMIDRCFVGSYTVDSGFACWVRSILQGTTKGLTVVVTREKLVLHLHPPDFEKSETGPLSLS